MIVSRMQRSPSPTPTPLSTPQTRPHCCLLPPCGRRTAPPSCLAYPQPRTSRLPTTTQPLSPGPSPSFRPSCPCPTWRPTRSRASATRRCTSDRRLCRVRGRRPPPPTPDTPHDRTYCHAHARDPFLEWLAPRATPTMLLVAVVVVVVLVAANEGCGPGRRSKTSPLPNAVETVIQSWTDWCVRGATVRLDFGSADGVVEAAYRGRVLQMPRWARLRAVHGPHGRQPDLLLVLRHLIDPSRTPRPPSP